MRTVLHLLPHTGGGAETYIDLLERLGGLRHARLPFSSTRSRWGGAASVAARWPRVAGRARGADILHAHGDTAAILAAPLLRQRPSLITTHGLHRVRRVEGGWAWPVARLFEIAVRAATVTVCTSHSEREELTSILPPALHDRLVAVPNGMIPAPANDPARRRRERETLGLGDGEVVVLYVGRLEAYKDPLTAIAAVEMARARGVPLVLLIAGVGPLESRVSARASEAIRPLGQRDDVERLYAAADLFVLPSRREGMPMALLEAMSHGLAPVVSDAPGSAEAVEEAGVIVPASDERALSDQLVRLAADPGARARLGAAARDRISKQLSVERFLARMLELYRAVGEGAGRTEGTGGPQGP